MPAALLPADTHPAAPPASGERVGRRRRLLATLGVAGAYRWVISDPDVRGWAVVVAFSVPMLMAAVAAGVVVDSLARWAGRPHATVTEVGR